MAIYVYGTSHVSEQSLELIEEKIDEHDPSFVALELDMIRLNALLSDQERTGGPLFIQLIKRFQDFIGSQTGVMPGEEMKYAYKKATEEGREVALIDQDIRITVEQLKNVRFSEKLKAAAQLVIGTFMPGAFNFSEIPEEQFIDQLLFEFKFKFPEMHKTLVEQRNQHMVEALKQVQTENPNSDIVAFVGAAHRKALDEKLSQTNESDS